MQFRWFLVFIGLVYSHKVFGYCEVNSAKDAITHCDSYNLRVLGAHSTDSNTSFGSLELSSQQSLIANEKSIHASLVFKRNSTLPYEKISIRTDSLVFQIGSIESSGVVFGAGRLKTSFGFTSKTTKEAISEKLLARLGEIHGEGAGLSLSNKKDHLLDIYFLQINEDHRYRSGKVERSNTISLRSVWDTNLLYQTKLAISGLLSENESRGFALSLVNFSEEGKLIILEFRRMHFLSGKTRFQQSFTISIEEEWKANNRLRILYYDQRDALRYFSVWKDFKLQKPSLILSYGLRYNKEELPKNKTKDVSILAGLEYTL